MPDHMDHDEFDTRIRALVARAVADAPAPPELEPAEVPFVEGRPDRRGWWLGGSVAALAAAALVTAFVLVGDTDESVTTPNTEPATSTTPAPTTTAAPEVSTTMSTIGVTPSAANGVLTAGPAGVVEHRDGEVRTLTAAPMAIALDAGDGRVIVQRNSGAALGRGWEDEATVPMVLADDGSLTNLFDTADWEGAVVLHDIEVVTGRRLLLFSLTTGADETFAETLYVVDLDTMERTEVAPVGGLEGGTHRLHLATTGLIVGQSFSEGNHAILIEAVPGSPAVGTPLPTAADLGLELSYYVCTDCPHAFTVTPEGRTLMWIDGAAGMLVGRSLAGGETVPIVAVPAGFATDVDVDDTSGVISFSGDPAPAPVFVPFDGSSTHTLEGAAATRAPLGAAAVPDGPPSTTTTTPTAPPPTPAGVMLATAGADGVTVIENGVEIRRLDQPAEIALLTPGGAVIFQPARATPEGTPGDPLIWRPDGTVEPLLGPLGERQSYRLHDLASVAGTPTLLYGVATAGTEPAGYTEVVHALTMTPGDWTTAEVAEISTWEGGFDRLSLSNGGTVIGTAGEETLTWFVSAVVTGSPDSAESPPSPAQLGVEPTYSECWEGCPRDFTISHDGESIVWTEGSELVVFDTVGGGKRSWAVPALTDQPYRSLDVRTSSDGGVEVAISFAPPGPDPSVVATPVVVATSPPGDVVETPVAGRVVTFGP